MDDPEFVNGDDSLLLPEDFVPTHISAQVNNNSTDAYEESNGLQLLSSNFCDAVPVSSEIQGCDVIGGYDEDVLINDNLSPEENLRADLVDVFDEIGDDHSNWLYDLSCDHNLSDNTTTPSILLDWLKASFNEDHFTMVKQSLSARLSQYEDNSPFFRRPEHSNYGTRRPSDLIFADKKVSHPKIDYSTFKISKRKLPSYASTPSMNQLKYEHRQPQIEIPRRSSIDELSNNMKCIQPIIISNEDSGTPADESPGESPAASDQIQSRLPTITPNSSQLPSGSLIKRPSALPKFSSNKRGSIPSPLASPRPDYFSPSVDSPARSKAESILQRRRLLPPTPTKSPSIDYQATTKLDDVQLINVPEPMPNLPPVVEDVNLNPLPQTTETSNDTNMNSKSADNSTNSSKENLNRTYSKEELSVLKAQFNDNNIVLSSSNNSSELDDSDDDEKPRINNAIGKSNLGKSMDCLTQKRQTNPSSLSYQRGGLIRSKSTFRCTDYNKNNSISVREKVPLLNSKRQAASSTKLTTINDLKSSSSSNIKRSIKAPSIAKVSVPPTPVGSSFERKSSLPVRNGRPNGTSIPRPSTTSSTRALPSPKVTPNNRQVNSAILPRKVYKK